MTSSDHLHRPATEAHIDTLMGQMTLDEKIGQLNQYFSWGQFNPEIITGGHAGSVINASGALSGQGSSGSTSAEICNHIQKLAMQSRLRIPQIFGRDVIHGYRTIFPIPLGQAAAWDAELAGAAAAVAAHEASADGISWTFAPMLDIARDARWGRIAEGNGEDPYLSAKIARAVVKGFQGDNMADSNRIVACAKHYVGYGAAEGGRDYENGEISEPTLRDIYLPPYQAAVDAGVGTLMSAFIDLNGVPATANRRLLTDVLRGEWGFQGFVVSDWESVSEVMDHGLAESRAEAAALSLHAGVDMDMISNAYVDTLAASVKSGFASLEDVETAVRRILRVKHLAGLFENPYTDPDRASREMLTPESRALARRFAARSMVLLKNDAGLLPLDARFRRVLVAGPFVHARSELFGTWTPDGRNEEVTALSEAMRQNAPKGVELWFAGTPEEASAHALYTDIAVLVLGEHPRRSGENANVSDLGLPPGQEKWIEVMAGMGIPLVTVVLAGRSLALTRVLPFTGALLYAWHPGTEGGAALADVLFGVVEPGGRLPVTFPRATGQVPIYYNHKNSGRPIERYGKFRTRYVDLPDGPLYPFGYGLAYTRFDYKDLKLSSEVLRDSLEVSAEIQNTGDKAGSEVVQLYVRDLHASLTRPVRELKGFQRVELQPGEARRVRFTLSETNLAFWGPNGGYITEPGRFQVWVAPHSAGGLMGEFKL
jgi:beta-glucosidase